MTILRINQFQWGSVGRYIQKVSVLIGLEEVSWESSTSLQLRDLSTTIKQAAKKKRIYAVMDRNMARIEEYVEANRLQLGEQELVALRTLYLGCRSTQECMKRHLQIIEVVIETYASQMTFFDDEDQGTNDEI